MTSPIINYEALILRLNELRISVPFTHTGSTILQDKQPVYENGNMGAVRVVGMLNKAYSDGYKDAMLEITKQIGASIIISNQTS